MIKECAVEKTTNYTASEFIKTMRDISKITGDIYPKDYAILVEALVDKEYGYDVTMNVLRDDHESLNGFNNDLIGRCIAFVNERGAVI